MFQMVVLKVVMGRGGLLQLQISSVKPHNATHYLNGLVKKMIKVEN